MSVSSDKIQSNLDEDLAKSQSNEAETLNSLQTGSHEIFIPADGDCLYTSVFIGYLLPVLQEPEQFNQKLLQLVGLKVQNSNDLREWLLEDLGKIDLLRETDFKEWIALFKKNMGVDLNTWGGKEEIAALSNKLGICIQEIIQNIDNTSEDSPYIKLDLTTPDRITDERPEMVFILRTRPNDREAVDPAEDSFVQEAQLKSASSSTHLQHYRLVSIIPIPNISLEDNDEDKKNEPDLDIIRLAGGAMMVSECIRIFQLLLNPPVDLSSQESSAPVAPNMQQAVGVISGMSDPGGLFSYASQFVSGSSGSEPNLKTSESDGMKELMVRVGMIMRPEYFNFLKGQDSVPEDAGLTVAYQIFQEFIKKGALDQWDLYVRHKISETEKNPVKQLAMLEFWEGILYVIKYVGSDAVHDPLQDPLNKYIDIEFLKRAIELRRLLDDNHHCQNYDKEQHELMKLDEIIRNSRERRMRELKDRMFYLLKLMRSDLSETTNAEQMIAYHERKWERDQREEFENYILNDFYRPDAFEANKLRAFWEKLYRNQYGKVYYQMVCESFFDEFRRSPIHQVVQDIWGVSCLDTIHDRSVEARSRMPASSVDGSFASNFGYKITRSDAFRNWVTNPLVRSCSDIIMDAFHYAVDLGRSLDTDIFLDRFKKDLSRKRRDFIDRIHAPHLYDSFMHSFKLYLLEKVFCKPFKPGEINGVRKSVTKELLKAAEGSDNLFKVATEILTKFKDFSFQMFLLRPDGNELTEADRYRGLVFGIGFSGVLFDSPEYTEINQNKIWLSFSQAGRNIGGCLLAWFTSEVSRSRSIRSINSLDVLKNLDEDFNKYRSLIKRQVNQQIKEFYRIPDWNFNSSTLNYIKKNRIKLEDFMSQLELEIPFNRLGRNLKNWINDLSNWYCIPHGVTIGIPEEIPTEEYEAQKLARELVFDALTKRQFSVEHNGLMPQLFHFWKNEVLAYLLIENPGLRPSVQSITNLTDLPDNARKVVLQILDRLVWAVSPELISPWQDGRYGIIEVFSSFMKQRTDQVNGDLKKARASVKKFEEAVKKASSNSKTPGVSLELQQKLEAANEQLAIALANEEALPRSPSELNIEDHQKFKKYFFEGRSVSQCLEPVFARVLGHDRFFSVYISKQVRETNIIDPLASDEMPLQLGNRIPQDVIAPCNRLCQYHALGHLYVGDLLSYQNADRLDRIRTVHNRGVVPDRSLTMDRLQLIQSKTTTTSNATATVVSYDNNFAARIDAANVALSKKSVSDTPLTSGTYLPSQSSSSKKSDKQSKRPAKTGSDGLDPKITTSSNLDSSHTAW